MLPYYTLILFKQTSKNKDKTRQNNITNQQTYKGRKYQKESTQEKLSLKGSVHNTQHNVILAFSCFDQKTAPIIRPEWEELLCHFDISCFKKLQSGLVVWIARL